MNNLALGVVVGILILASGWWFSTQRKQRLVGRVIVPLVLVAAGIVLVTWTFSTRDVSVGERLRIVEHDPTLSAIPPGAARRGEGADDCPDAYGGPYYHWQYSYEGPLEPVFRFYDQRLKADGWQLLTPARTSSAPSTTTTALAIPTSNSTTTSISPPLPTRQAPSENHARDASYSKSYGSWMARATVRVDTQQALPRLSRSPQLISLLVTVADHPTRACTD